AWKGAAELRRLTRFLNSTVTGSAARKPKKKSSPITSKCFNATLGPERPNKASSSMSSPAVKAPPFPIRSNAPKLIPTKSARPWSPANVMRSVSGEHRNSPISDSPQPHEPSTPMDYERSQPLVPPQEQHWPKTVEYLDFEKIPVAKPKPLIKNLLDCGSRILFGGGSKTFK